MAKIYITFGQVHTHRINGKTLDCDCVAVINCGSYNEGRMMAMEWFDRKFHNSYFEGDWKPEDLKWYPRGLIEVNPEWNQ